jgi:hypothetical protein
MHKVGNAPATSLCERETMGELLQLLTAAKSLGDQEDLQATVNQHADAINQQAQNVQILQGQIDSVRSVMHVQFACTLAVTFIVVGALIWYIHTLEKKIASLPQQ